MRRRPTIATATRGLCAFLVLGALVVMSSGTASAASTSANVDIVKVTGLIDPLNANLVARSLVGAAHQHALALVIQLNSTGATISPTSIDRLAGQIMRSPVPVAIWVGGSGRSRAEGLAFTLLRSGDYTGEAPGSRVGGGPPPPGQQPDGLEHRTMSGDDAVDAHIITTSDPTLVDFLGDLSGKTIKGTDVDLGSGHGFRKDLNFDFSQLSVIPKLLHTAASPDVAFVMLLIALSLVVFEFFTAGVGVAAGTGILFGLMAAYGLGVLPTRPYAVVLLALSVLAFGIDIQAGAPRFWTAAGAIAYLVGALELYDGHAVALWVVVVMGLLLGLLMINGMPAMVRTRFSTPTIGRQSLIGTMGLALSEVDPDGTVRINGAPWRARTNRATPIRAGDVIRVVAIDGLLLEVEPETGGAKDAHH